MSSLRRRLISLRALQGSSGGRPRPPDRRNVCPSGQSCAYWPGPINGGARLDLQQSAVVWNLRRCEEAMEYDASLTLGDLALAAAEKIGALRGRVIRRAQGR